MKRLIVFIAFIIGCTTLSLAQSVTRTQHRAALTTDAVSTGTVTIRKPDYINISTDNGKEQLTMDGTRFTMTLAGKKHVTDSRAKNKQFATFHKVLQAVINRQPIPTSDDMTVSTSGGQTTITITPAGKKRQLFTSFVLVVDSKSQSMKSLRMNGRKGDYTLYTFK